MMKTRLYIPLLLTILLSSCELYMDELQEPGSYDQTPDPKKELVTEESDGTRTSYSFTEATVELTDQYDEYIVATQNDSILYFREDTPNAFLPKPDDVLFSKMREKFPDGLARKVTEVKKADGMFVVTTQKCYYTEVFTDLIIDGANAELPSYEFTNYADATEPVMRMPGESRAGDTELFSGEKFKRIGKWEIHFSKSGDFDLTKFTGHLEGEIILKLEMFEKVYENDVDIFKGNISKRSITIYRTTISGEGKIYGDIQWKPFEKFREKLTKASAGVAGYVMYPDLTINLTAGMDFNSTYSQTQVYESIFKVSDFSISKKSGIRRITDKYGAGISAKGIITGYIDLTVEFDMRFGIAIAGDLIEAGAYFKVPISFTLTLTPDTNCKELSAPSATHEGYTRTYNPRNNNNLTFKISLGEVGQYFKIEVPTYFKETFDKLDECFSLHTSFVDELGDIIKHEYDEDEEEGIIRIDFLGFAKKLFKFDPSYSYSWTFFPELNTKSTYMSCTNVKDFDRMNNHIKGTVYFNKAGMSKYEKVHLLVYDYNDNYLTSVTTPEYDELVEKNKYGSPFKYTFDFELPVYWDTEQDNDYYKIYPCYQQRQSFPNPGAAPDDMFWTFYCDRPIIVKNYRPCANLYKTHQNMFFSEEDEKTGTVYYCYYIRTYAEIMSTPDVKDWGLAIYLSKDRISNVDESKLKKCRKAGSYMFKADEDGNRSYMNCEGTVSIDLSLSSKNVSVNGYYVYLVPFYKEMNAQSTMKMLYKDAVRTILIDSEDLENRYSDELQEIADQTFSDM